MIYCKILYFLQAWMMGITLAERVIWYSTGKGTYASEGLWELTDKLWSRCDLHMHWCQRILASHGMTAHWLHIPVDLDNSHFWHVGIPRIVDLAVSVMYQHVFMWSGCKCPSGFQVIWQLSVPRFGITPLLYPVRKVLEDVMSFWSPFVSSHFVNRIC